MIHPWLSSNQDMGISLRGEAYFLESLSFGLKKILPTGDESLSELTHDQLRSGLARLAEDLHSSECIASQEGESHFTVPSSAQAQEPAQTLNIDREFFRGLREE